ncbi:MAG: hypothetical protein GY805_20490, partial [Chloroflexi bacterium]|nr:hypothetical protein [Chloroflexota bacterium]
MTPTIQRAAANQGTLGGFCNVAMLCKAIYGRLPEKLPATLEDVIDGSVKTGLDLSPVQAWNQMALTRMVKHGQSNPQRAMPQSLLARLPEWLRTQAAAADSHWLDTLTAAMELHKAQYWADVEALATEACPPIELFENGRNWLHLGKELRQAYSRAIRKANRDGENDLLTDTFAIARSASETFLKQWPTDKQHNILIGAAAYLYTQGSQPCQSNGEPVRDGLLWQLGKKQDGDGTICGREPGIAQMMLNALRQIGLLGDPVWTTQGAVLHYQTQPQARAAGVPIRLNGV